MITPSQIPNPYIKPRWQTSVGVMESIVKYNCRVNNFPAPVLAAPFWEGGGNLARDYSGRGNHGTLTNGPAWVANGIDFDGTNDYINVPNSSSLETDVYTLVFKARFDFDIAPASSTAIIGMDNDTANSGWWLSAIDSDLDTLRFATHTGNIQTSKTSWVNGQKYGISLVQKTFSSAYIYIDGELDQSGDNGYDGYASGQPFLIGFNDSLGGTANKFDGIFEYVYYFDTALSAAQVKFLHYNPYFMYKIPEELYGYVAAAPPVGNPAWYYNMLKRRN